MNAAVRENNQEEEEMIGETFRFVWEQGKGHPYIVHLCDWFSDRDLYLVMEFCECGV